MKLIDADMLMSVLNEMAEEDLKDGSAACTIGAGAIVSVMQQVDNMPAIEAKSIKHGRWIQDEKICVKYRCSECGHEIYALFIDDSDIEKAPAVKEVIGYGDNNYCSHCGAKMSRNDNKIKTFKEWFEEFGVDYLDIWGESDNDPSNSQWSFTTGAVKKMIDVYETEIKSI